MPRQVTVADLFGLVDRHEHNKKHNIKITKYRKQQEYGPKMFIKP